MPRYIPCSFCNEGGKTSATCTCDDQIYPCAECKTLRSRNEGGTTFTVCDACWDKHFKKEEPEIKIAPGEYYKHVKTSVVYKVICNALIEKTKELAVVYQNVSTSEYWVRPATEFNDGRFERISLMVGFNSLIDNPSLLSRKNLKQTND